MQQYELSAALANSCLRRIPFSWLSAMVAGDRATSVGGLRRPPVGRQSASRSTTSPFFLLRFGLLVTVLKACNGLDPSCRGLDRAGARCGASGSRRARPADADRLEPSESVFAAEVLVEQGVAQALGDVVGLRVLHLGVAVLDALELQEELASVLALAAAEPAVVPFRPSTNPGAAAWPSAVACAR